METLWNSWRVNTAQSLDRDMHLCTCLLAIKHPSYIINSSHCFFFYVCWSSNLWYPDAHGCQRFPIHVQSVTLGWNQNNICALSFWILKMYTCFRMHMWKCENILHLCHLPFILDPKILVQINGAGWCDSCTTKRDVGTQFVIKVCTCKNADRVENLWHLTNFWGERHIVHTNLRTLCLL